MFHNNVYLLSATVEERNTLNAHDKIVSSYARA